MCIIIVRGVGLVTSRAESSFEHFEPGLLISEGARARAELLNELKIRLKLGLILKKKKLGLSSLGLFSI